MATDTMEEFKKAWKTRFPSDKSPRLDCLDADHPTVEHFVSACQLQYDSTRHNIEMLQHELHQQEFIASFLYDQMRNPPNLSPSLDSQVPLPRADERAYHGYASVDIVGPRSERSLSLDSGLLEKPSDSQTIPVVTKSSDVNKSKDVPTKQSSLSEQEVVVPLKKKTSSKGKSKSGRAKGSSKKQKRTDTPPPVCVDKVDLPNDEESSMQIMAVSPGESKSGILLKAQTDAVDISSTGRESTNLGSFQKVRKASFDVIDEEIKKGDAEQPGSDTSEDSLLSTNKPVPVPRQSVGGPLFKLKASSSDQSLGSDGDQTANSVKTDLEKSRSTKKKGPQPPAKPIRTSSLDTKASVKGENKTMPAESVPQPVTSAAPVIPPSAPTITNVDRLPTIDKPRRKLRHTYESISFDGDRSSLASLDGVGSESSAPPTPDPQRQFTASRSTENLISNQPTASPKVAPKPSLKKKQTCPAETPPNEAIYEEALPVMGRETVEEASSSDEEEPIYFNILLVKQQTLRTQNLYASLDMDKSKRTRELQPTSKSLDFPGKLEPSAQNFQGTAETQSGLFGGEGPDAAWKKRGSMQRATDSVSEDDSQLELSLPLTVEGEKTQTRKLLVTSILDSEHGYVASLDILMQYMQTFKNVAETPQSVITTDDINVIFYKIPDLHRIHYQFIHDLEPKVQNWSANQQIAENFKILALAEYPIATEFLRNYQDAVDRIKKCTLEKQMFRDLTQSIQFKGAEEKPNLEELLHKPVVRFQRNTLVLHDLIACTPPSHPDYDLLQKTLRIAQNFLENFQNPKGNTPDMQRYLVKQGLIVERSGNGRKLRHVFLFNDILVCAKQKVSKQRIQYEVKWFIALSDLATDDHSSSPEDKRFSESQAEGVEDLKQRVAQLQSDLQDESKKARQAADGQKWFQSSHNNRIEKIKKKLLEQEAQLVLASPHLIFRLRNRRTDKAHVFLMASDYERVDWQETIDGLQAKASSAVHLSSAELQNIINSERLPKLHAFQLGDDIGLDGELLFGCLVVNINKLQGLSVATDMFCLLEVDTFSHFFTKAKTNVIRNSVEPVWNEDFEIDLEGAQTLRILCYKLNNGTDILAGKCALELSKAWLRGDFLQESVHLSKELTLVISMRYVSREATLKRTPSAVKGGVFGVRIANVTKREGTKIPLIVTTCIKEIEHRGIRDVGIYRISGVSAEIQRMKKAFERNSRTAADLARETDVNVLTGLLKLYLRELPEALFTDNLYPSLLKGMNLTDPEAKEKFMLSLIYQLPQPNKATVYCMLDHMIRIADEAQHNKMSLNNLATVFGPTLLKPASHDTESMSIDQLFSMGARDAMLQSSMLLYFLNLRQQGVDFNSGSAYVTQL